MILIKLCNIYNTNIPKLFYVELLTLFWLVAFFIQLRNCYVLEDKTL